MGDYRTLDSEQVYAGRSNVRIDTVEMPDGATGQREIVEHDDAVAVVPVTADGDVLLLRQYRQAVGGHVLEIPAGTLDVAGEAPDDAAARELAEETGHAAARLERLATMLNSAGWTDEATHLYLGHDVTPAPAPDGFVAEHEEAEMELVRVPIDEAIAMAAGGEITDAKTLAGLLLVSQRPR